MVICGSTGVPRIDVEFRYNGDCDDAVGLVVEKMVPTFHSEHYCGCGFLAVGLVVGRAKIGVNGCVQAPRTIVLIVRVVQLHIFLCRVALVCGFVFHSRPVGIGDQVSFELAFVPAAL